MQVKNFHAHEKEYWHNQQQEQLERLDGMFQEYKQSSRKGNKSDRGDLHMCCLSPMDCPKMKYWGF